MNDESIALVDGEQQQDSTLLKSQLFAVGPRICRIHDEHVYSVVNLKGHQYLFGLLFGLRVYVYINCN